MDKAEEFLIKINSRNKKWRELREKERIYSKLLEVPSCADECLKLKEEIDFIRKELDIQ